MASLRRNKTLSPDGQTAKFLYTIIKQLDLKAIDWNLVAGTLEITNGHAARMRYSRFKQHMEGAVTQPRAPRASKKEGKEGKEVGKKGKKRGFEEDTDDQKDAPVFPKSEPGLAGTGVRVKRECVGGSIRIKSETDPEPSSSEVHIKPEPGLLPNERIAVSEAPSATRIKQEPEPTSNNSVTNPDIWHILPHAPSNETFLQNQVSRSTTLTSQPLDPALRQSHPLPAPLSTVSLADLEVSPRSQGPTITGSADTGTTRRSNFMTGFASGQQNVLGGSAGSNIGTVQIKAEPLSDMDWMITGPSTDVMVKSEPLEI
ncbi:hypothetical protein GJ744_011643 [Endocarpon pusillum]|uniref:Myb-like DNA-binding domain-containing protein n=1 Tax=Endocarpon pusillum TaxID=364733 RepID=A0A8H7E4Q8_9EURO|nr:hypothetical protein GJ744_011643 [Endocarpon pusillum]